MPHERFMRAAITLAKRGLGRTSPNPIVGAVIVKEGRVIGRGYHRKAGLPHAEIEAIAALGDKKKAKGATLYVTLEPCCHFGRTPPCTDAILSSSIKKVVVGAKDPNPLVAGKGIKMLESAGVAVISGVLEEECTGLNEAYAKYITTKTPFITLKLASSLDGRIATAACESRWITGVESRRYVHRLRALSDAVMVGSSTVIKDDPELTVRLVKGKNPKRVVVDSSFQIPLAAKVFSRLDKGGLIVFTTRAAKASKMRNAESLGAEVVVLPATKAGVSIGRVSEELGKRDVTSLLIEGGSKVAASALKEGVVDKLSLFLAPVIIGGDGLPSINSLGIKGLKDAPRVKNMISKRVGDDILVEGYLKF